MTISPATVSAVSAVSVAPVATIINRYAGWCRNCGASVPAGGGLAELLGGRWQVRHRTACPVAAPTASATRAWSPFQNDVLAAWERGEALAAIACAGSGKSTLAVEMARRVPKETAILAFAKRDSEDLNKKLGLARASATARAMTSHALGKRTLAASFGEHKVLKGAAKFRALMGAGPFAHLNATARDAVRRLREQVANALADASDHAVLGALALKFSIDLRAGKPARMDASEYRAELFAATLWVIGESTREAQNGGFLDFVDMIHAPILLDCGFTQYERLIVDEAQDQSPAQIEMARRSLAPGGVAAIVGDPMQAIYAWRGAASDSLDRLKAALGIRQEFDLPVSYRTSQKVTAHVAATWRPGFQCGANAPAGSVTFQDTAGMLLDLKLGDAIISRTNKALIELRAKLLARKIPVAYKGRKLDDVIAVLRDTAKAAILASRGKKRGRVEHAEIEALACSALAGHWSASGADDDTGEDLAAAARAMAETCATVGEAVSELGSMQESTRDPESCVTLSTVHGAKGDEWACVYVLRNTFKGDAPDLHNLGYVADTRAKTDLVWVRD